MIVCVEAEGKTLWVDPTASHCPFLNLPWQDQGVRALVITPKASHLATTPSATAEDNRMQTEWDVTLDADGGLTAQVQERISGQEGCFFRDALGQIAPDKQSDFFHRQIAQTFPQAQLTGCTIN